MTELEEQRLFEFGKLHDQDNQLYDEKPIKGWPEDNLRNEKLLLIYVIVFLPILIVQI